jgi:hypothetical protein
MKPEDRHPLADKLRELTDNDERSVTALALESGVNQATWYRIMKGEGCTRGKLDAVFGVLGYELTVRQRRADNVQDEETGA